MVSGGFCVWASDGTVGEERASRTHRHRLHTGLADEVKDDKEAFARLEVDQHGSELAYSARYAPSVGSP